MFPALAVTTPPASSAGDAARIAESAPRSLNEPIGCRYSSFSQMRSSKRTSGVRRTASPSRSRARRISSSGINRSLWRARSAGAHGPELGEHLVLDQAREQLDRRALRADDVLADDPRDDLEVAEAPHADALVPLGQKLGELVQLLVLAPARVHLEQREPALAEHRLERVVERRRDAADLAEAGRVEARAVTEHAAHLLVLPRRHQLEVLEEPLDVLQREAGAAQQPVRGGEVARLDEPRRLLRLDPGVLEPELRRLVHRLEEQLVAVHPLVRRPSAARAARRCGDTARSRSRPGPARIGAYSSVLGRHRSTLARLRAVEDLHRQVGERDAAVVGDEPRVLHVEARLAVRRDRVRVHRQHHARLQLRLVVLADLRELDHRHPDRVAGDVAEMEASVEEALRDGAMRVARGAAGAKRGRRGRVVLVVRVEHPLRVVARLTGADRARHLDPVPARPGDLERRQHAVGLRRTRASRRS